MFCSKCGSQLASGAAFCPNCGTPAGQVSGAYSPAPAPTQEPAYTQAPAGYGTYQAPTSGLAIAALVVTFFAPLIGLILGYSARKDILISNGAKGGRGVANAAIALGWIFTLLGFVLLIVYIAYFASLSNSYNY